MKAGRLRHQVKLQQRGATQDSYGQTSTTWSDVATVWAAVEPLAGNELLRAQAVNAEVTGKITIRYRAGVTAEMRVLFGTRIFDVKAVINVEERNREMVLFVSEGLDNG